MAKVSDMRSDDVRFQELLPFYVNGTLTGQNLAWFQHYIASHPGSHALVEAEQLWAHHVKGAIDSIALPAPESEHMDKVYAHWQAQRVKSHWISRLRMAWAAPLRVPAAWLGAGGAALVGQLAIILVLLGGGATVPMRGGAPPCQAEPLLRLTFSPNATWQDVVLLLRTQGWTLRNGPSESGQIWVALPVGLVPEAVAQAATKLPLVESTELSPGTSQSDCQR